MLILVGLLVVIGSVCAGYLLEKGNLLVLMQPNELLIIAGGAVGILLASCPPRNLRMLWKSLWSVRTRRTGSSDTYLEALKLLYVLFQLGRGGGLTDLETHVEQPDDSLAFQAHPTILEDREATDFICDSFRIMISAGLSADKVERLMPLDMDIQRSGRQQPLRTLTNLADALPGLGIIAAVLGVVVTMQALNGPAADIGQKVAAALVGTFLGILLCYGIISPIANHVECLNKARAEYLQVLRVAIVSAMRGDMPLVATETGRRSIPLDLRPSYDDLITQLRQERIPRKTSGQEVPAL
jgi:chemotaxis protein MotA